MNLGLRQTDSSYHPVCRLLHPSSCLCLASLVLRSSRDQHCIVSVDQGDSDLGWWAQQWGPFPDIIFVWRQRERVAGSKTSIPLTVWRCHSSPHTHTSIHTHSHTHTSHRSFTGRSVALFLRPVVTFPSQILTHKQWFFTGVCTEYKSWFSLYMIVHEPQNTRFLAFFCTKSKLWSDLREKKKIVL